MPKAVLSFSLLLFLFLGCGPKKDLSSSNETTKKEQPETPDPCEVMVPDVVNSENPQLKIYSKCRLKDFEFKIYDRWGTTLFSTNEWPDDGIMRWDYSKMATEVYIYIIRWSAVVNGEEVKRSSTGHFSLVR